MDIKIRKVVDNIFEIEKDGNMKVPVRIYASEKLLNKMKEDRTLIQAKNVASLPGIVGWAVVMPDGHEGYGFPVGGVAAFDIKEGIISPGGIGYDINCLGPNEKVLFYEKFYVRAKDLDKFSNKYSVVTLGNNLEGVNKFIFLKRKLGKNEKIYVIETEGGRKLEVSYDHPIYILNKGWVYAKDVKEGDEIVVYPFDGVEYDEPKDKIILDKEDFKDYDVQIVKYLEERNLLPLKLNDPKVGILARIYGYILGNGNIIKLKDGRFVISLYGEEYGLERLRNDLKILGIKASKIYGSIRISSKAFSILLMKLGIPYGKKIEKEFFIPEWIKESPRWIKANFISGLFSSGSKPTIKGEVILPINLTFVKVKELENNLINFLEDIKSILKEFDIEAKIHKVHEYNGKVVYRLYIEGEENVYNFLSKIGYSYSYKEIEGLKVLEYLKRKKINRENIKISAIELYNSGKRTKEIVNILMEFEEFIKEYYLGNGLFRDKIIKIELKDPDYDEVYDISLDKNNNFFANNILVHNCGVRVIRTNLTLNDVKPKLKELVDEIFRNVPAGVGETGKIRLSHGQFKEAVEEGLEWAYREGYAWKEDMYHVESYGKLENASLDAVSDTAIRRGIDQLGTLGSGNHFLEIQVVDKIFDPELAKILGIEKEGQITIMIHTGSRGFGHQIASDYIDLLMRKYRDKIRQLPDRELVYAEFQSEEGQNYWKAMSAAANFAWNNRQLVTYWVRKSFEKVFRASAEDLGLHIIYDVAHNIAKIEEHEVNGRKLKVIVHRKGATRAFPPGHPELIEKYRNIGQPVLIPGSMGTASYILIGQNNSMKLSFGSSAHGAGRMMSRAAAKRSFTYNEVINRMQSMGILVKSTTKEGVVEEVPEAYKDVDEVVKVTHELGISKMVVRLRPIAVIKG